MREDVAAEEAQKRAPVDHVLQDGYISAAPGGEHGLVLHQQARHGDRGPRDQGRSEDNQRTPGPSQNEIAGVDEEENDVVAEFLKEGEVALNRNEQGQYDVAPQPVARACRVDQVEESRRS